LILQQHLTIYIRRITVGKFTRKSDTKGMTAEQILMRIFNLARGMEVSPNYVKAEKSVRKRKAGGGKAKKMMAKGGAAGGKKKMMGGGKAKKMMAGGGKTKKMMRGGGKTKKYMARGGKAR
jgi:hypothetical protein